MVMDINFIAKNIKYYRVKRGLSQRNLADELFITRQAVSKWETAQTVPNLEVALKLCKILGITLNDLVKEKTK